MIRRYQFGYYRLNWRYSLGDRDTLWSADDRSDNVTLDLLNNKVYVNDDKPFSDEISSTDTSAVENRDNNR